jgi:hypothetical protein
MPPTHRRSTVATACLVVVTLFACSDEPDTVSIDLDRPGTPELTEISSVGPYGQMSPDGRWLWWTQSAEVCAMETAAGGTPRCVERSGPTSWQSAQWSPDGRRVVFTNDFFRAMREPDIWTLELESMQLDNLTDDDVDEFDLDDDDPQRDLDLNPSWESNSSIVFLRHDNEQARAELMRVSLDGEIEEIGTIRLDERFSIFNQMHAIGGDRMVAMSNERGRQARLVTIDLDTADMETVARMPDDLGALTGILDVSADGKWVMVYSEEAVGARGESVVVLVELATGEQWLLIPDDLATDSDAPVFAVTARFTPDSKAVVVGTRGDGQLLALRVADVTRGVERSDVIDLPTVEGDEPLTWAPAATFGWDGSTLVARGGFEQIFRLPFES